MFLNGEYTARIFFRCNSISPEMVLIVDDLPENLLGLRKILELNGFKVDEAYSGEEALKKVLVTTYSLIILDVQMPGMDGFEVAEALAGFSKAKDIPVIFLSAVNTTKEFITRGYLSGGYDYITKPLDPDILLLKAKNLHKLSQQNLELKKTQAELEKEIEVRKEAERKKDEFLSIASHELKTPLTRAKGYVQLLKKFSTDPQKKEDSILCLQRTETQLEKLNLLVAGILDLSNIEAGKMQFKMAPFNCSDMIENILETFSNIYPEYTIIRSGELPQTLYADKDKIEQVVLDFLFNAAKYSQQSKEIYLNTTTGGNSFTVEVRDTGVGISAEKLPHLFQKYYRAEDSYNEFQGLGISLFICSVIIRHHKGTYGAKSVQNEGSSFYFTIPVAGNE
ncbi:phospho-acceptor domain-containing protein [Arcticibacter tournemirensis]|nr:phospho-acceptor domain-containing protein [Arcticibacter tournemirensis]